MYFPSSTFQAVLSKLLVLILDPKRSAIDDVSKIVATKLGLVVSLADTLLSVGFAIYDDMYCENQCFYSDTN
jgi:hypothetical protein